MSNATQQSDAAERDGGFGEIDHAMTTPEFFQNPYPLYARMRRDHPVYRGAQGIWYLTRYADVEEALGDPRLSHDRERTARAFASRDEGMRGVSRLMRRLGRTISNTDPPEHTRLRKLVTKAFTTQRIHRLRPRIQALVDELLDAAAAAGSTMDLIPVLAAPLPAAVIGELFGIPHHDRERVTVWFRHMSHPTEDLEHLELTMEHLEDYLAELIRSRQADPADDLISALVTAQDDGDHLTDEELLCTCFVLITAGDITTTNLICNGTVALLRHPDQLHRLHQDPTLIRSAVNELMRYDTPSQILLRVAADTTSIGGQTLAEGDLIYLVLAASNRDPHQFINPDQLDLTRRDNRHLSFGHSTHFCLGAPLSRLETEIAIGTLIRRLPTLHLDTETLQWWPNPMQRGLTHLPLAY
ncbi:MAG: cytochrome P450 family protein [Pseudonocardiaceae bacterium]